MIDLILPRRQFLAGLAAALAAPAIVRVDSLMKLPKPKIIPINVNFAIKLGDFVSYEDRVVGVITAIREGGGFMMETIDQPAIVGVPPDVLALLEPVGLNLRVQ